ADQVVISLAHGVKTGMERILCRLCILHSDIERQQRVHRPDPVLVSHRDLTVKVDDLCQCMYTAIRSSARCHLDRMMVQTFQCFTDDRFDAQCVCLAMTSGISAAIVSK